MKLTIDYDLSVWALPIAFGYDKYINNIKGTIEHSMGIIILCVFIELTFETKLKTKLK